MGELVQAVARDREFSPHVRIECLDILLTRMLAERPELVNPINLVRMCHQAATIHNERRGNPRGVMPEATALLRKLGPLICGRMTGFKAQEVSNTAWAYATLNVSDGALFSALSHRAQSIIGDFKAQGVSNTAWAFAVHVPELVNSVASAERLEREEHSDIAWLQLYQALIAAEIVPTDADRYERYRRIVASYERSDPSRFENSIGAALQKALSSTEYSIEFGRIFAGVVTDWVVEFDGRKVVVECDGTDYHTTRGPDAGRRLGKDILQDRIFARFGYEAIHIDSGEWGQAPDGVALLRERLGI